MVPKRDLQHHGMNREQLQTPLCGLRRLLCGRDFTSGHLQRKDLTPLEISEEEERVCLIPAFKAQLHPSLLCINLRLPCLEKALGKESWHLWTAKNIH